MIAGHILRQQDKVPSGTVYIIGPSLAVHGFVVSARMASPTCAIDLAAHNRLERLERRALLFRGGFAFLVEPFGVVQQLLNAVHVTVVGKRYSIHAGGDTFVHDLFYLG